MDRIDAIAGGADSVAREMLFDSLKRVRRNHSVAKEKTPQQLVSEDLIPSLVGAETYLRGSERGVPQELLDLYAESFKSNWQLKLSQKAHSAQGAHAEEEIGTVTLHEFARLLQDLRRNTNLDVEHRLELEKRLSSLVEPADRYMSYRDRGVPSDLVEFFGENAWPHDTISGERELPTDLMLQWFRSVRDNHALSTAERAELLRPIFHEDYKDSLHAMAEGLDARELGDLNSFMYSLTEYKFGEKYAQSELEWRCERLVRQVHPIYRLPRGLEKRIADLPEEQQQLVLRGLDRLRPVLHMSGLMDECRQIHDSIKSSVRKRSTFDVLNVADNGWESLAMEQVFRKATGLEILSVDLEGRAAKGDYPMVLFGDTASVQHARDMYKGRLITDPRLEKIVQTARTFTI